MRSSELNAQPCHDWVPDFCADLNAIHAAEITLTENEALSFWTTLGIICNFNEAARIRATAAQRAEAFLRAKGLWREDDK
jgi:hypothetical protein